MLSIALNTIRYELLNASVVHDIAFYVCHWNVAISLVHNGNHRYSHLIECKKPTSLTRNTINRKETHCIISSMSSRKSFNSVQIL